MAFWLKKKKLVKIVNGASTLDPQASLVTVLSIIILNHFKIDRRKGPQNSEDACQVGKAGSDEVRGVK